MRWRVPIAVVVGGLLLWGAWSLQRIFGSERDRALAALTNEEHALASFARVQLERTLQQKLEAARPRIELALRDPLTDDADLVLMENGEQRLPRRIGFRAEPGTPASHLLAQLRTDVAAISAEGPWAERLELLRELDLALRANEKQDITRVVRALLNHRASYVLPVVQEAPFTLRFVELLVERTTPDPSLVRALLREGVRGSRGQRVRGLQPLLLARRDQLSREDVAALTTEIAALCQRAHVDHEDFAELARREPPQLVNVPLPLDGPALVDNSVYVEPYEETGARGVAVDLSSLANEVSDEMRTGGLLRADDELHLGELGSLHAVSDLALETVSPTRRRERSSLEGRYRLKSALAAALVALAGLVVGLAFVLYRREQRFLQSKADFVATVSHELRTPLASMRVMAETLERRLDGHPEARDFPARLVGDVDRLAFLVDNILSFNRLDKGGFTLRPGSVTLTELANDLRHAFDREALELSANEATWQADPDLMKLLFSNLIANACKYNERSPVRVELSASDQVIRVRDNGVGIPMERWNDVFDEFTHGSGQKTGFGLGLAICRRIMTLHGGTIRIAESSPDGTTFELEFRPGTLEEAQP